MINEELPTFAASHDPDDVAARNVEIGGWLRALEGVYSDVDVFLDSSNTDTALVIGTVAYDPDKQRVSWRQTGGSETNKALDGDNVTLRVGYRIVLRLFLTDGRHYDRSVWQEINHH